MLSDLKLVLGFDYTPRDLEIILYDRHGELARVVAQDLIESTINLKFSIPNQITFVISNLQSGPNLVKLKKCSLGGLELTQSILDQICMFTPLGDEPIVTTNWWKDGKVIIDFFANNWVQYHLLYGNKIVL